MNTKKIINEKQIVPKKKYGQNFLVDQNIINKIINSENIKQACLIEIGPGMGALTKHLVLDAKKVVCYEIDHEMVLLLNNSFSDYPNLTIVEKDFLKCDLASDLHQYFNDEKVVLMANLPYYITTPIISKIIKEAPQITSIVVMVQKEVAERICGKPSTKDYNSLSVLIQYYMETELLFDVSPQCFIPKPKVTSSVIKLVRKKQVLMVKDENFFFKFIQMIFSMRRKTLYNNLKNQLKISKEEFDAILKQHNLPQNIRAENLSVEQIVMLANEIPH